MAQRSRNKSPLLSIMLIAILCHLGDHLEGLFGTENLQQVVLQSVVLPGWFNPVQTCWSPVRQSLTRASLTTHVMAVESSFRCVNIH